MWKVDPQPDNGRGRVERSEEDPEERKSSPQRYGNWLNNVIEVKRPGSEVRDTLDKVEKAYDELVVKQLHETHR